MRGTLRKFRTESNSTVPLGERTSVDGWRFLIVGIRSQERGEPPHGPLVCMGASHPPHPVVLAQQVRCVGALYNTV
jgi:hypothetical protein